MAGKPKTTKDGNPKPGRPSLYSEELADRICEVIATADRGLIHYHRALNWFPAPGTICVWLNLHKPFREKYARAKEMQGEFLAFQAIEIADESQGDYTIDAEGREVVDHEYIARSKLRYEARRWLAGKIAPKNFGDKVQVSGDAENPVRTFSEIAIKLVPAKPVED